MAGQDVAMSVGGCTLLRTPVPYDKIRDITDTLIDYAMPPLRAGVVQL